MTNVRKTLQMNKVSNNYKVSKILLWHCLAILPLIVVRGVFSLLTNENIIFMSKIVKWWLKNCAPFNSYLYLLLVIACKVIFDKVLKNLTLLLTAIFVCKCLKVNVLLALQKYGYRKFL